MRDIGMESFLAVVTAIACVSVAWLVALFIGWWWIAALAGFGFLWSWVFLLLKYLERAK